MSLFPLLRTLFSSSLPPRSPRSPVPAAPFSPPPHADAPPETNAVAAQQTGSRRRTLQHRGKFLFSSSPYPSRKLNLGLVSVLSSFPLSVSSSVLHRRAALRVAGGLVVVDAQHRWWTSHRSALSSPFPGTLAPLVSRLDSCVIFLLCLLLLFYFSFHCNDPDLTAS